MGLMCLDQPKYERSEPLKRRFQVPRRYETEMSICVDTPTAQTVRQRIVRALPPLKPLAARAFSPHKARAAPAASST